MIFIYYFERLGRVLDAGRESVGVRDGGAVELPRPPLHVVAGGRRDEQQAPPPQQTSKPSHQHLCQG